uniref:Uncharacterized protein n=1 Tax=Arundo donax TaxID=35708 RepID=A0A0A9AXQ9_ARUDO
MISPLFLPSSNVDLIYLQSRRYEAIKLSSKYLSNLSEGTTRFFHVSVKRSVPGFDKRATRSLHS